MRLCRTYLAQCGEGDPEKNRLHPHLKKQWGIGAITAEYLARREDLLHLYNLPYNAKRPVVGFAELPVQLRCGGRVTDERREARPL